MKTEEFLSERQKAFYEFVKRAHAGQKRKYTGEDYHTHPYEVAKLVSLHLQDTRQIEIALGHDLFEDTEVDANSLYKEMKNIGYELNDTLYISLGINSLSDSFTSEVWPHWNRTRRKEMEAERLSRILPFYQTVKYADLIHNTSSIVEFDKNFAKIYLKEKEAILARMRFGDFNLLTQAYQSLWAAEKQLNGNP